MAWEQQARLEGERQRMMRPSANEPIWGKDSYRAEQARAAERRNFIDSIRQPQEQNIGRRRNNQEVRNKQIGNANLKNVCHLNCKCDHQLLMTHSHSFE
jgi:hypothetical protein